MQVCLGAVPGFVDLVSTAEAIEPEGFGQLVRLAGGQQMRETPA